VKRKRLDRDTWTSITKKTYRQKDSANGRLRGVLALLSIEEAGRASIWPSAYGEVKICGSGMKWLQILPDNENYMITAIYDRDELTVVYIDIINGSGRDIDGVYFIVDLYLDVIVYPNGNILIDDRDELFNAYREGRITDEQFRLVMDT
jgi:predicted RNA-binding protein associated with RNAse of E/G family